MRTWMPSHGLRRRRRSRNENEGQAPPQSQQNDGSPAPLESNSATTGWTMSPHFSSSSLTDQTDTSKRRNDRALGIVSVLIHTFFLVTYLSGMFLRTTTLHTGDECDMTYSVRHFIPIHVSSNSPYKLFKFTDGRDPRHRRRQSLTSTSKADGATTTSPDDVFHYCRSAATKHSHIVLYVPGHWGSYSQSRSLGAHGIQLTRHQEPHQRVTQVVSALRGNYWRGNATHLSQFVYDVYAIDFLEQGAGLHGRFMHAQADFVATVLHMLVERCQVQHITVVGHSIGGVVARAARELHPSIRPYMRNLITLASPHAQLSYAFDQSVYEFYDRTVPNQQDSLSTTIDDFVIVSISGGLRDEMIAPELCLANYTNALTLLANDIMVHTQDGSTPRFGMDHRAVVWCHNILSEVRKIVHVLATSTHDTTPVKRIAQVQQLWTYEGSLVNMDSSFAERLAVERQTFRRTYGYWKSIAMESAMMYRLELLLGLYVVGCCLYMVVPDLSSRAPVYSLVVPIIQSLVGWTVSNAEVPPICFLCMAFVANGLFWTFRQMLRFAGHQWASVSKQRVLFLQFVWIVSASALVQIVATVMEFSQEGSIVRPSAKWIFLAVYTAVPATSWTSCRSQRKDRDLSFSTMVIPLWPCLIFGKLDVVLWATEMRWEGTRKALFTESIFLGIPVFLRLVSPWTRHTALSIGDESQLVQALSLMLHLVAVIAIAPSILRVGGGHATGPLLMCMAWIGYLEALLQSLVCRGRVAKSL